MPFGINRFVLTQNKIHMKKYVFVTLFLLGGMLTLQSFVQRVQSNSVVEVQMADGCDVSQNLDETCRSFIGRCRRGGINSEFPGQFYDVTIRVVKDGSSADHKKAWKLLNDNRFVK